MAFSFGTPNTTGTQSTFGFNNPQSPKPAAFSFGGNQPNAQSPAKPAIFGFGGQTTNTAQSPAKPAIFGFGGQTTNTAQSPAKPGAFSFTGTTTSTPSFSLGGTSTSTSSTFNFAGGGSSGFGFSNQAAPTQDSSQVAARIEAIKQQINGGPYDRFKFVFYNKADQNKYRKPDKMSEQMWKDAMFRCPSDMVPVLATGFNDLKARRELQDQQRVAQEQMVENIGACIEDHAIKQQEFQQKLADYRKIVAHNITRILHILSKVEYLRRKGQPLNRNEEHLFSQLDKMRQELSKPGQYGSHANELMSTVKSQSMVENDYPSLDDESIVKVQDILASFITALSSIMKDVNNNAKSLDLIEKSFHESYIESTK